MKNSAKISLLNIKSCETFGACLLKQAIIIPIGSQEQHGPHLPPNTDYLIARATSEEIRKHVLVELDDGILISHSPEHQDFKETKSISQQEFISQVIKKLSIHANKDLKFIINAHGGNTKILKKLEKESSIPFKLFDIFTIMKNHFKTIRTSDIGGICHAGEFETSLMLFLNPRLVHLNDVSTDQIKLVPNLDPNYEGERPKNWKTMELNKHGILGNPLLATREKGEKWFTLLIKDLTRKIENLIK